MAYCATLVLDGYDDWILPSVSEFRTVVRNCPATEPGGICELTDTCYEYYDCYSFAVCGSPCSGMGVVMDENLGLIPNYSIWTRTEAFPQVDCAYVLYPSAAGFDMAYKTAALSPYYRCIRIP
jgi:hypothetical protein